MATAPRPRRTTPRPKPPQPAPQAQAWNGAIPIVPLDVPIYRYRVMFSDGDVVDFLAPSDHSGYREQMLDAHWPTRPRKAVGDVEHRIEGIAHLGQVYVHMPNTNWPDPPAGTLP